MNYVYLALKELASFDEFSLSQSSKVLLAQYAAEKLNAAQQRMHLIAFGAFLAGGFVGGILMLIVLVGLYGGR